MPTAKRKRNPRRKKSRTLLKVALLVILALVIGATAYLGFYVFGSYAPESNDKTRIYIPAASTDEALRDTLVSTLGDDFGMKTFRAFSMLGGNVAVAHGSYVVEPGTYSWQLARTISRGRQTPVKLTFNNIRRLPDLAKAVDKSLECSAQDFMSACDTVLPTLGYTDPRQYTAAFLPDTYEFYWTASPNEVVRALNKATQSFWNGPETPNRTRQAKDLGLTPVQVATLASIVESETNNKAERPIVARLYLNRLNSKMKLQADPTVKFAMNNDTLRRINTSPLKYDSPYNTYIYPGLLPGPIRMPERSTIDDVLNAPQHNYIYMCAKTDGSGTHHFSDNYDTHIKHARNYRNWLDSRGIK